MHDVPLPFDSPLPVPARGKRGGQVPKTSVLAYEATDSKARMAEVLRYLMAYWQVRGTAPTSAELTTFYEQDIPWTHWGDDVLFVRRGLSDAKRKGLVEHSGKRICRVAGTLAICWKVASR